VLFTKAHHPAIIQISLREIRSRLLSASGGMMLSAIINRSKTEVKAESPEYSL
jgi:hypothetical protein